MCINMFFNCIIFGQSIIRGPYLQKGTTASVIVKWRTNVEVPSVIEYCTDGTNFNFSVCETTPKVNHKLEITGLAPNTKYFYRIGFDGTLLAGSSDLYFKTNPIIGTVDSYRFWLLGCTYNGGINNVNALKVRDAYYSYSGSTDTNAVLFLGDNAGSKGLDSDYQLKVFDMYESKLKNTLAWSCIGNHDGYSSFANSQTGPYYDIFEFPTAGESGGISSNTESYYSFDYGNIHFIVLNSFDEDRTTYGPMYKWAELDIKNTEQKWVVAMWHHPPYSKGWHPSEGEDYYGNPAEVELTEMREIFGPMLENNGVDLVITAHSLSYERSFFINGHYGESNSFNPLVHIVGNNGGGSGQETGESSTGAYSKSTSGDDAGKGTIYVTTSTSTQNIYSVLDHNAMFYSSYQYGSSILEINGDTLNFKFLRDNGNIDDFFTIHKSSNSLDLIEEVLSGFKLYTDEFSSYLFVNGNLIEKSTLFVYDIHGRLVLTKKLDVNKNFNRINVQSISSGIYIVKLSSGGFTLTKKIIIK